LITQEEIDKLFEWGHEKEMLKRILEEIAKIQAELKSIKRTNSRN
jgi:hypothetical protein